MSTMCQRIPYEAKKFPNNLIKNTLCNNAAIYGAKLFILSVLYVLHDNKTL